MADLTFQSQQMAAEQSNIGASAMADASATLGSSLQKGVETYIQQKNINTERGDRQQQWQEQRQDRARQTEQEASLQNKALDQRAGMFEQEIAQRREEFALEKVREQRMAQIDMARAELLKIERDQRKLEHEALEAIGKDKMQQQLILSQELDLREKAARVAMLEREAQGLPSSNALFQALHDPEKQERWGIAIDINGKARSLTDDERGRLRESLGRREVGRVLETLVKSTAEYDAALSGKFAVVAMKVATGRLSIEEAEQEINALEQKAQQASGIDGAAVKPVVAAKDDGPFRGMYLGGDNASKVHAFVKANINNFRARLQRGFVPSRAAGTPQDDASVIDLVAKIINNPRDRDHEAVISFLAAEGLVDIDAYNKSLALARQKIEAAEARDYRQPIFGGKE